MICRQCDCANDADANYCNACGSVLTYACRRCGQDNRSESRFCKSCGRHLHAVKDSDIPQTADRSVSSSLSPSTPARVAETTLGGERKHLTVLFTDLCGYTAMSERMDPEEVKEILAMVFGEIVAIVKRYEGFIEKFVGDAIMAVFGASRTHEDEPL